MRDAVKPNSERWTEVSTGVFVRRHTSLDLNVGAVICDGGVLVIDTRASHVQAAEMVESLRAITKLPVRWVINTHHHWDHTFGNQVFPDAAIWGHERCAEAMRVHGEAMRAQVKALAPDFAATLDAERRLGRHVQSIYIHGLVKGKRGGEYNPGTGKYDGAIRQSSVFCYGYRKPANPPMEPEQWAATFEYYDPYEQKAKRLGKAFQKVGVWELPDHYLPPDDPGMSKAEFWAKWIPSEARRKNLLVIGPFSRQTQMVEHFLEETLGEEERWQAGLWALYDLGQQILATYPWREGEDQVEVWWRVVWPDEGVQSLMNRLFPRSYECRRYGARSRCQFEEVCLGREGWGNPIGSGQFIDRRPHHRGEPGQARLHDRAYHG